MKIRRLLRNAKSEVSESIPTLSASEQSYKEICQAVFEELITMPAVDDSEVRRIISKISGEILRNRKAGLESRKEIENRIFNRFRRLDILQPLMDDPEITEIMVNGPEQIFFEKNGRIVQSPQHFENEQYLTDLITGFFSRYNEPLSQSHPLGNLRLPDGSRAHAVLFPIAQNGPILTIRKFSGIRPTLSDLIQSGFLSETQADYLSDAIRQRKAIMIGGGTGSGKTTLLNILSAYIPADERIITVEDSPELQLQNRKNWVRLTCRQQSPDGSPAIDNAVLIRNALRMRPDRIIVGEVRGDESYDMLLASATGHPGTLCTIHGNNCESMLFRLADLVLAASRLAYEIILRHLASAFQILVYIARDSEGNRFIGEIGELSPDQSGGFHLKTIYRREA